MCITMHGSENVKCVFNCAVCLMAVPVVKQVVYSTELQKLYFSYLPGMIMVSPLTVLQNGCVQHWNTVVVWLSTRYDHGYTPVTVLQSGCIQHWNTEGVLWLWARYDHGYTPVTVLQSGCIQHWNAEGVLWLWTRYDHGYTPVTVLQSGCMQHWNTEGVLWLWARYDHGYSPVTVFYKAVVYSTELQVCCGFGPVMSMVTVL